MGYRILRPDNPEAENYLFSGENILSGPKTDSRHIEKTISNLHEDIVGNGIFALGPALGGSPIKEHAFPGIPENKYNMGLLGIYIPPEFADQLDREETTIEQAFELGKSSRERYADAAQHVISGYIENGVKRLYK
ncbi:MAG: hypothetical protein KAS90_00210 [Candidatus Aenigmarchaeota archaeon]|nr:hypothetical protein [Candidatus Aenigmarchaeota archaeon]